MFSIRYNGDRHHEGLLRFRPLSGIVFSIKQHLETIEDTIAAVSVPSRGLCFQSIKSFKNIRIPPTVSVPSRGLCFQSASWQYHWKPQSNIVSVPSRGLCFQSFQQLLQVLILQRVSVPSRGLCFQSMEHVYAKDK